MTPIQNPVLKFISHIYQKEAVDRESLDQFKHSLKSVIERLNLAEQKGQTEEHLKEPIAALLNDNFYRNKHYINTHGYKGNIEADMVIHEDAVGKSAVKVLFEIKRPGNNEMITVADINRKALHEAVLYYLYEKTERENHEIAHIIITDGYGWFFFDAAVFQRVFYENKALLNTFNKWKSGGTDSQQTAQMYDVLRQFIAKNDEELAFVFIDLRTLLKYTEPGADERKLIPIYKLLSPRHLLKQVYLNDSNHLNRAFYNELLHIIGLEEVKDAGKKLIRRKTPDKRNSASLLENTIQRLKAEDKLSIVPDVQEYGNTEEEQLYNVGLALCITWINRILFLKLLEGQLIRYHKGNRKYAFLDKSLITEYDELNMLFFDVLAITSAETSRASD